MKHPAFLASTTRNLFGRSSGTTRRAGTFLLVGALLHLLVVRPGHGDEPTDTVRALLEANTDGTVGLYLKQVNGPVLAAFNESFVTYPASTIKVLEHLHAMRAVEAGTVDLDTAMISVCQSCRPCPSCDACNPLPANCAFNKNCQDLSNSVAMCSGNGQGNPGPFPPSGVSLRCALQRMMRPSDNRATNGLQEFFGSGDPSLGRIAMNLTGSVVIGMTSTELFHKFKCGNVSNNPYNTMTLEDIGRLYEKVAADGSVLPTMRDTFYDIMLNESNGGLINAIRSAVNEEARNLGMSDADPEVQSLKSNIRLAYKGGNIPIDSQICNDRYQSIAGWVEISFFCGEPVRQYVFGYFIDDASQTSICGGTVVKELLRQEIRAALETIDRIPPDGSITSPQECECFGPNALPVGVADDFIDACPGPLTRNYLPGPGPFVDHGDYNVALTVEDGAGLTATDQRHFTIDLLPPEVGFTSPQAQVFDDVTDLPIPIAFASRDDDGATGGVVFEQVLLDGQVVFDGTLIGDLDGRLSDEIPSGGGLSQLSVDLATLCESPAGLRGAHTLTVLAEDCGGNVSEDHRMFSISLPDSLCAEARSHTLVINEVDYDQGPVDSGEFVEIKNIGSEPVNLKGYALRTYFYAAFETYPRFERYELEETTVPPGEYFVICTEDNPGDYCDQRVIPKGRFGRPSIELLHEHSPAAVVLVFSPTTIPYSDELVDSVCYIGSEMPGDPGYGLPGGPPGVNLVEGFCNSQIETVPGAGVSRVPDGRDRDSNLADLRQACITPRSRNVASTGNCALGGEELGQLVVNELDYSQPGYPDSAEFVEIKNVGPETVNLGDYEVVHRFRSLNPFESSAPMEKRFRLPQVVLPEGGYYVLCLDQGNVAGCDAEGLFHLNDWNGSVALVHNVTGKPEHDILVDSMTYGEINTATAGGPLSGGRWAEGDPEETERDEATAAGGFESFGLSRVCDGADTDNNATDFRLVPTTPGMENVHPQ